MEVSLTRTQALPTPQGAVRAGEPASVARPEAVPRAEGWIPNALGAWREIAGRLREKRVALFLDYDGTLAAIAPSPSQAVLTKDMRSALDAVAHVWPTAIVTGRALADIERLVGLPDLVFAGSHGFDVRGPGGLRLEVSPGAVVPLREAAGELRWLTRAVPGVLIEEKRFSVALHYRQAPRAALPGLERTFRAVLQCFPTLRATEGKAVLELRPAVDWGKGRAVLWLLQALGLDGSDVLPVYIGDDLTDADAFRALAPRGLPILVSNLPWSADARYALADVLEVRHFLLRLASRAGI